MGSSKIMGYNLDDSVLDGVAMQSTSEEILDEISGKNAPKSIKVTTTTTNAKVVEFTGRGRVYFGKIVLAMYGQTSTTPSVEITIDGDVVLSVTGMVGASSAGTTTVNIGNPNYGVPSGSNVYYLVGTSAESIDGSADAEAIEVGKTITKTEASINASAKRYFRINGYLEFNESFSVELIGNSPSSGSTAFFSYSLLD